MPGCDRCGEENPARARFCLACGAPLVAHEPPRTARKVVTVVFCDLVGSTALGERLDPEALRTVLGRYFATAAAALGRHGGKVEKFIGDAVMCVFGIPVLHEDDALRALRAVADLRREFSDLNEELGRDWGVSLAVRIGVNTGPVVAGDPGTGQALVTGDAVNTAARLEQAAKAGEVLIGDATRRLVADAVETEPVAPLSLRGKSAPLPAWRLLAVRDRGEGIARRHDAPLVGRRAELRALRETLGEARRARAGALAVVVGEAGVGKSRLLGEFERSLAEDVPVVRGHCLSYGEGITFWPIREIVLSAAREESPAGIAGLLDGEPDAKQVGAIVAAALGLIDLSLAREEIFWAVRRLLESMAGVRGLIMMVEDVHWAEPTLLDLLQDLAARATFPLLIACSARPDVLDVRPEWAKRDGVLLLRLGPLSGSESAELLGALDPELSLGEAKEILRSAEGNPLFLEQMRALRADSGEDGPGVPPTIEALLAARIDRLPGDERRVAERAAVVGRAFWPDAVGALIEPSERSSLQGCLEALERRELVAPGGEPIAGRRAHHFRHALIRDAAYAALPKGLRADLHERVADWLEEVTAERMGEHEELSGHHLERAYRLRVELRPADGPARALAGRAGSRLGRAGRRALGRGDMAAAADLLGRAVELLSAEDPGRLELLCDAAAALVGLGEFVRADGCYREVIVTAEAAADEVMSHRGRIGRAGVAQFLNVADPDPRGTVTMAGRAAVVFRRAGDELGQAEAWLLIGLVRNLEGRWAAAVEALERARGHARSCRDRRLEADIVAWLSGALATGPTPVGEALARCRALADAGEDRLMIAHAGCGITYLSFLGGWADEARRVQARSREIYESLGYRALAGATSLWGMREAVMADPALAEDELRAGYRVLEELGEAGFLSTVAGLLAEARLARGDLGEAEDLSEVGRRAAADDDTLSQVLWRGVRARILARRGEVETALALAGEALALATLTDSPTLAAGSHLDLAEILAAADRASESRAALSEAHRLYRAKGAVWPSCAPAPSGPAPPDVPGAPEP